MSHKKEHREQAADKASKEWLREYLGQIYGINFTDQETVKQGLTAQGTQISNNMIGDEFAYRLMSRFNDLDFSPSDGFITMPEIEEAIVKPKLHFDAKDILMLGLLKKYFAYIKELGPSDNPGISRADCEALSTSLGQACTALRKRIEEEFSS